MVYSAMTRARDELIMTYVGEPSVFLEAIADQVDSCGLAAEPDLQEMLARLT